MRRCVNLRKVPGWHLLEEGGGEKERGGERSGWSDAKTRNFLLQVVLEQTNSLSNVIKIFKEGKSRNWRKKWNWPLNHGVCTLKKSCSTYSHDWEHFARFAQCLSPGGDNKWSADSGKFDCCLYLNIYNLKTYMAHFSFQPGLGRACPAVLIVHLYSSSCSTIETYICGVSEEIYLFRDTKDTLVLKTGFLHTRCKKGTNKTLKMTSHRQICENCAFDNPFPWL